MIKRFIGLQSSGKTGLMTLELLEDFKKGRKIFTNYWVCFPHFLINQDFILDAVYKGISFPDCSFGLDEYWMWMADARLSMSEENRVSSYFMNQSSKSDTNIKTTAQTNKQDDGRLRDNAHFKSESCRVLKRNGNYEVVLSEERILPPDVNKILYIRERIMKNGINGEYYKETRYIPAWLFFNLYKTEVKIRPKLRN